MARFQLQGSMVWDDISHPPSLLMLLQYSKQLQPATWGPESPSRLSSPFLRGFSRGINFLWPVLFPSAIQGMAVFCHQSPWEVEGKGSCQTLSPASHPCKEEDTKEHEIAGNGSLPSLLPLLYCLMLLDSSPIWERRRDPLRMGKGLIYDNLGLIPEPSSDFPAKAGSKLEGKRW